MIFYRNISLLVILLFLIVIEVLAQPAPQPAPGAPQPPAQPATTPQPPAIDQNAPNYNKPLSKEWAVSENVKEFLISWLIDNCWTMSGNLDKCNLTKTDRDVEYEGYDGFYNNLAHPELGAIDTPLLRRTPAAYEDGVYEPSGQTRPNPLELSDKLLKQEKIGNQSLTGKTALLVFFGQQVVEEILDAQRAACPPEYFNIKIPKDHPYLKNKPYHSELPILRTRYDMRTGFSPNNPRQQLNEITPWLDGGLMYGTSKTWSDHLRMYKNGTVDKNGKLASSHDGLFPEYNTVRLPMANPPPPFYHDMFIQNHETARVDRFFKLGNPRGNENPFLLTFGILWFRWHNHLAHYIRKSHPEWSGEKVYNEARKWVIATQQHIVVEEWLPAWLGKPLGDYKGYNPGIDPQIDQFFQAAAFRFGHTLVPPGVYVRDYARKGCKLIKKAGKSEHAIAEQKDLLKNGTIRTCNSFWRPQEFIQAKIDEKEIVDIDRILMGMAFQLCEREDDKIVEDLRGRVFGPLEFSRRDLMAINIQRGRDHGLPDYNTARKAFNLEPRKFSDFNIKELEDLYEKNVNNIDIWVGGILETKKGPGELFTKIIEDQFTRIRDGDRFWYENKNNGLFTSEEIERIKKLTVYDIIVSVTKILHGDIQERPFEAPSKNNGYDELNKNCKDVLIKSPCEYQSNTSSFDCFHLEIMNERVVEACTDPETYDYFSNSEISFILTFVGLGLATIGFMGFLLLLAKQKKKRKLQKALRIENKVRESFRKGDKQLFLFSVLEWVDRKLPLRPVVVVLDPDCKQIQVKNQVGNLLRVMDLTHSQLIEVYIVSDGEHLMFRVSNDYDLVLKFESDYLRENFLQTFEQYITIIGITRERINVALHPLLRQAVTRRARQKRLEMFFRVVFSQAFKISHSEDEILKLDSQAAREIIYTELTMSEFAEALSMPAESEFVRKMFTLADKDKNGFISFREFVDMLIIFAKGTADDKAKLMFDMYDINATGQLTLEDFKNMITSLMETVSADVVQKDLETAINSMMRAAGLANKDIITVEDFQRLLSNNKGKLGIDQLNLTGIPTAPTATTPTQTNRRGSFIQHARLTAYSIYRDPRELQAEQNTSTQATAEQMQSPNELIDNDQETILQNTKEEPTQTTFWTQFKRIIENYAREVFWLALYTIVLLAIFAERAYYYSVEREHSGLRRIAGYGVTVTRGAASAMMFTYSTLLVTMCRNTITVLRDTVLHMYIPFDTAVSFHKYVALWALVFTVMHCIGHAFNFYSISTQTSDDLTCLFRNFFHSTHEIPKFHYWCWQTITGVTGILLTLLTALIFIFALPFARTRLYNAFWFTHSLYPIFYVLMILHGAGRLIQPPFFYYFFLGPSILFTIDRLISIRRKKVEIPVITAELLPSAVTFLEFKKPNNFEYKSGQWVRIACPALNTSEYHPFTLSSSPNEKNLTVHIRAVGPWTTNIRSLFDLNVLRENPLPKIHLDGPYGEGHQDWYQFDVAVLVGGGIGVTPFASILKDIVFRANIKDQAVCKKVYFLWVTKTQKHFEWLVDIIRELENADKEKVVSTHIFITQFYQKFDLRTILLYICERHFQRLSNRSLLTGLKAVTHFGRPNFTQFFKSIQAINPKVRKVGVFSCGPPPMTQIVDKACLGLNKETYNGPIFQHHFKNF